MAYLIDETYFKRELYVPNVDELNSGAYVELMEYIDSKSRLCLKNALNNALFNDLDSYIVDGILDINAPQKWINLVNGVEYVKDAKTYNWQGLLVEDGAFKESLLATFTFYYWLEFNQSKMSGVGEVIVNAKNAVNVNSIQRLVKVWNSFIDMYQGCNEINEPVTYLKDNVSVIDWLGNDNSDYVSLIQFLKDNETDYPSARLKKYNKINQLGI